MSGSYLQEIERLQEAHQILIELMFKGCFYFKKYDDYVELMEVNKDKWGYYDDYVVSSGKDWVEAVLKWKTFQKMNS